MSVRMMFAEPEEIERMFTLMVDMKVSLIRLDFDWSAIETVRGHYDWSYTDRIVEHASDRGIQVIGLLAYTPQWARDGGDSTHLPPRHAADFAGFARDAARRYSPRVRWWEIWNEPNSSDYWEPRPDVRRYGELFREAAAAIREIDAEATLITGGLTRGTDAGESRISQTRFLDGLYRMGAAQHADVIGVHPYSFPELPADAADGPVGGFADLPALRDVLRRWRDLDTDIWVTEFGAPTGSAPESMSERDQALSLSQAQEMARSWDWLGPIVFYELRDAGVDPTDLEDNFGVLRHDLSPKQSATALMQ